MTAPSTAATVEPPAAHLPPRLAPVFDPEPLGVDPDQADIEIDRAREWTAALSRELTDRGIEIDEHRAYYAGTQEMRFATDNWTDAFGETFGAVRSNWMPMVVDSATERMEIQGYRLEPDAPEPDDDAWEIWQANRLDLYSGVLHTDTITTGWGYTLIWPDDDGDPRITVEDPKQAIVWRDPADRRRVLAGLKRWRDLVGRWHAVLFTPDRVWTMIGGDTAVAPEGWTVERVADNPVGVVPLVEFVNNPDIWGRGRSDLTDAEPLQDAIDKTTADMLVASEFTAYRQRVLIGADVPTDENDEPLSQAQFGITRLFTLDSKDAEVKELEASDLSNYTNLLKELKNDIAALKHVPPQYLLGAMVNVSGDALQAAESGLYSRVRAKLRWFGEAWEETIRLAFRVMGLDDYALGAEILWKDPEITSEATRVDALVKLSTIGVPKEALWGLYGATQETIRRWRRMADDQAQREALEFGIAGDGLDPEPPPPPEPEPAPPDLVPAAA